MDNVDSIVFLIDKFSGGGAERVISILANEFSKRNKKVTVVLTDQKRKAYIGYDLDDKIECVFLCDILKKAPMRTARRIKLMYKMHRLSEKLIGRQKKKTSVYRFVLRNIDSIYTLNKYFVENKSRAAVAFLNHSIELTLLAAYRLDMRVVISERCSIGHCDINIFDHIYTYYDRADMTVFQSEQASLTYPEHIRKKSTVIFNPLKEELPMPYCGKREKIIVNFCRINFQKNLPLLLEAFLRFHKELPEYKLQIIGAATSDEDKKLLDELNRYIKKNRLTQCAEILPFCDNIHEKIKNYAMFVSSSDFEGMSNSMLEAMAIGLPTICTDCPAGGAAAIIKTEENGLLTPVGDAEKLYLAMKRVAEDAELAEKLSMNGTKLRDELSVRNIVNKWERAICNE